MSTELTKSPSWTTITVHLALTDFGDALLYAVDDRQDLLTGVRLKQSLFAWHAATTYGTELEIRQMEQVELVVLPAEHVLPFFAEQRLLAHIHWEWDEQSAALIRLAPLLHEHMEAERYLPSHSAWRAGQLQWVWDSSASVELASELALAEEKVKDGRLSNGFLGMLEAAFSAAVFQRYYNSEAASADLRAEYPLLFVKEKAIFAGLDPSGWLMAVGWKADHAPFRPMLQLLEPGEETDEAWQLRLVLQDKLDPSVLRPVRLSQHGDVAGEVPAAWVHAVQGRSAGWLDHLRASLPDEHLAGEKYDVLRVPLSSDSVWRFLTVGSNRLLEAGWQVLLPAWWESARRKKPKLRAKVKEEENPAKGRSFFGLDAIIEFDWRVSVGDLTLTEAEFAELLARQERLLQFRGQWVTLDPGLLEQISKMMKGMNSAQGLSFQDVLQLHLLSRKDYFARKEEDAEASADEAEDENEQLRLEVELNSYMQEMMDRLVQQKEAPALPVPAGLQATLRAYQQEGYSWLAFMRQLGLGACLADDMGLGKTVQLIAYLMQMKETGGAGRAAALIICPTSVLGNWQKEISRFAPSLNVMLHYSSKRLTGDAFYEAASRADVILTSFATSMLDQELLQGRTWEAICLDEAQNIKNAQTKQAAAIRSLPAKHRIALTGTPIENRLSELWSIYDFMNPGFLGSAQGFQKRFATPIEQEQDPERVIDLQRLVKPFMLRRKKKDPAIQLDLPDKNEMKTYVHLTAEQGALYTQTVNELMAKVQRVEGNKRRGAILSVLTQLKQICNHPALLEDGMPLEVMEAEIASGTTGAEAAMEALISRSSKLERLMAMVKELRAEGERCLIFTQYIGMGQLLQGVLERELQERVLYLNGSTTKLTRDRMIERFQSNTLPASEQPSVFILSIKAGGVGLNLTAANHVFHFDRWWNPAVENQATDRAYRMGQTRDVQVHKFIALGTLEERIDEMLESKQKLSENVISSSSETWITELDNAALQQLVTLKQDWAGEA
ncbi:DEAD/DEAH box helicase [Paenibacillus algorifonticola]|uniref:DEAD/DEAH box helicase n=1 Tax=Paenibacillus algorifonticola TaxID=684063 RepID=UPI003D29D7B1